MPYLYLCLCVLVSAYILNIVFVTIFYHRAITHGAVTLQPWVQTLVVQVGPWLTGIDPKGWACMHRLHHEHSDTDKDPHSPVTRGIWQVAPMQFQSYKKILAGLTVGKRSYGLVVKDLEFPVSWVNRKQFWYLPYFMHAVIAAAVGFFCHAWLLAACYWVGIMSHPFQGWLVNALAHRFGYRNFTTPDHSKNNTVVAFLVFGEGYQNNHHFRPRSAKFSAKWWEVDLGYGICRAMSALRLLKFA